MGDADLSQVRQARSNKLAWGQFPVRGSKNLQAQYEKTRANLEREPGAISSREQDAVGATYARNKTYKYLETQMMSHIQARTTFKKIPVSTLKQWVFILHECLKMNLVDAMGRLVTHYAKLANLLKVKATKPITSPKPRKRKRQEHNSNTQEPAATPADASVMTQMVRWVQFGTVAEKAVSNKTFPLHHYVIHCCVPVFTGCICVLCYPRAHCYPRATCRIRVACFGVGI